MTLIPMQWHVSTRNALSITSNRSFSASVRAFRWPVKIAHRNRSALISIAWARLFADRREGQNSFVPNAGDFVVSETRRRCAQAGVGLENFDERLRCCQLHIALDSMAYLAFRQDETNLSGTIKRLLPLRDAPIEKTRPV